MNYLINVKSAHGRKKTMRKLLMLLCFSFVVFAMGHQAFAADFLSSNVIHASIDEVRAKEQLQQGVTVSGTVTDDTGEAIPGVTIMIKGTTVGQITDQNGKYAITVAGRDAVLQFSYIGFTSQEFVVGNKSVIDVQLSEESTELEEVVVVGYGVQRKVNLTGAVSMVKIDESMESRAVSTVSSGLSGLIPGLAVTQTNSMAGKAGSALRVRGVGSINNSDPLIVVDGMPDMDINDLNMVDIESISVLKDAASAAVYGSRAANGVVLITTKRGQEGKATINYTGSYGWESLINYYTYLADYPSYMLYHNRSFINGGRDPRYRDGTIEQWMAMAHVDPVLFPNTDWWHELFKTAHIQNHTLSASAGTERLKFYVSASMMDNTGISINTGYNRKNFRVNVDYKILGNVKVGANIDGTWSNIKLPKIDGINNPDDSGNMDVTKIIPGVTAIAPDGRYGTAMAYAEGHISSGNQYAVIMNNFNNTEQQRFAGNFFGEWSPVKGLTLRMDYGLNFTNEFRQNYSKPFQMWNFQSEQPTITITSNGGITNRYENRYKSLLQGRINYTTQLFSRHNLSAMVAYNEEYWFRRYMSGSRQDRLHPDLAELDAALSDRPSASGTSSAEGLRSVIGRVNYDMYNKYLIELNLRADASSKFLKGHQWGVFPSFSLGWRFSNEAFFESLSSIFSNGKLRGSWGMLGNNAGVSRYEQRDTYERTHYTFGGALTEGFSSTKLINENFSWEKSTITNIGLELAMLKGKLTTEIDVYNRLTSDMIRPMEISSLLAGYSAPRNNMGELRNRGIEVTVGWQTNVKDFRFGARLNVSYNKNKLISWNERLGRGFQYLDYPWRFTYTYKATGIAQGWEEIMNAPYQGTNLMAPGDILHEDLNGDGVISGDDRVALPNAPRFYFNTNYGLNLHVAWRWVDLSALLQASTGSKSFWFDNYNRVYSNESRSAYQTLHIDHWQLENRDASLPRLIIASNSNGGRNNLESTYWLYSRNYLRFKNIQLGFNVPKNILQKAKISNLRLYVTGENLFTISKWPGIDPEKPEDRSDVNQSISANNQDIYPLSRTFATGINLSF